MAKASASNAGQGPSTGRPAAPTGAAAAALRKRPVRNTSGGGSRAAPPGTIAGGDTNGILRFYTDDTPGIKIGPTTVLVTSLMFIGLVVLMHVWGKFRQ